MRSIARSAARRQPATPPPTPPPPHTGYAVFPSHLPHDARLCTADLRVYLAVLAAGAWHTAVRFRTRELAAALGYAPTTIRASLHRLIGWRYLERAPGAARQSWRLTAVRLPHGRAYE